MKKRNLVLVFIMALALTACAGKAANTSESSPGPAKAVESAMESLKVLDFKAFNGYTDNYIATYRNFLGIPVSRKYRVFNELQQTELKGGKRYRWNKELAEKIVENLSWEIGEVRQEGNKAWVDITLTNKDLTDVTGIYEINLIKGMIQSEGLGMMHLTREIFNLTSEGGDICAIVDEMDEIRNFEVTVRLDEEAGKWKVHLSEEFINAFMGNLGGGLDDGKYSEEVEKQLEELEFEMNNKADRIGDNIEQWAEGLFE